MFGDLAFERGPQCWQVQVTVPDALLVWGGGSSAVPWCDEGSLAT